MAWAIRAGMQASGSLAPPACRRRVAIECVRGRHFGLEQVAKVLAKLRLSTLAEHQDWRVRLGHAPSLGPELPGAVEKHEVTVVVSDKAGVEVERSQELLSIGGECLVLVPGMKDLVTIFA